MTQTRFLLIALLTLFSWALAPNLRAQEPDAESKRTAARYVAEGIGRFDAGDYASALARFEQAFAVLPSPKIYLNIASALGKLGREPEAAQAYDRYLTGTANMPDIGAAKRDLVRERLEELQRRLGRILVMVEPASATLTIDGRSVPPDAAGRPLYVVPGEHTIAASAPDHASKQRSIVLAAGESKRFEVRLERSAMPSPLASAATRPDAAPQEGGGRGLRIAGLVSGGLGLVAVALAVKYGLDARDASDRAMQAVTDAQRAGSWAGLASAVGDRTGEAESAEQKMWIFYGVAGALVTTGAVLYYFGHQRASAPTASRLQIEPGFATVTLRGRF